MLLIIYIPVTREEGGEVDERSGAEGGTTVGNRGRDGASRRELEREEDGERGGDLWYPRNCEPRSETLAARLFPKPCRRLKRLADLLPKRGGKMST